ncbi:MAG TPA: hypothetical protein ENK48_06715 [Gammaproteobacteria bacterium]|nr:hypothetical protein [Gammaproteobacteria bacterium]
MALRPLKIVPLPLYLLLAVALLGQLILRSHQPPPVPRPEALPAPLQTDMLRLFVLGEPVAGAKLLMLWLQLFDNQPGISIPFRQLDYARVEGWLDRALQLDPRARYPLLAASRLYGEVPDPRRQRRMLDFVYRRFLEDPGRRWPWLAHAVIIARHELHDLPLALKYARALADSPHRGEIPAWARQMHIFVLEDMGEVEAARILIGGLLDSGRITDPHELAFLKRRLAQMSQQPAGEGRGQGGLDP